MSDKAKETILLERTKNRNLFFRIRKLQISLLRYFPRTFLRIIILYYGRSGFVYSPSMYDKRFNKT